MLQKININFTSLVLFALSTAGYSETHRIDHAKELLGKYYSGSVVRNGEDLQSSKSALSEIIVEKFFRKNKKLGKQIVEQIFILSERHEMDPFFIAAVIESESSFRTDIVGPVGEVGLMQLRPSTAQWIAKREGISYRGKKDLVNPLKNIEIGVTYLSYLREKFDSHSRLYLSAYNMGARNVKRALGKSIWPKDYVQHVMKRYVAYYREIETASRSLASH